MTPVPAMSTMHEDVQEGTCKNEEERQKPKSVREVLGPKQDTGNSQQDRAHQERARRPEAPLCGDAPADM
jgi:hypothetical protein